MNVKKIIVCIIVLIATFFGGVWAGIRHYEAKVRNLDIKELERKQDGYVEKAREGNNALKENLSRAGNYNQQLQANCREEGRILDELLQQLDSGK